MNYNYLIKRLLQNQRCLKTMFFRHLEFCQKTVLYHAAFL